MNAGQDYPERRAVLRPGSFDRRAVDRRVRQVALPDDNGDAWSNVVARATEQLTERVQHDAN